MMSETERDIERNREIGTEGEPLETPIKVRWNSDTRTKFISRELEPLDGTPDDLLSPSRDDVDRCWNVMGREKTNVVVQTREELDAMIERLDSFLNHVDPRTGATWANRQRQKSVQRVQDELKEAREDRGLESEDSRE